MNLYNNVCRSFFVLALITAGSTVFPFATNGSNNIGTSLTGVSLADIWSRLFVYRTRETDAASANLNILVRDSVTGGHIPAKVSPLSKDASAAAFVTDAVGRGSFHLSAGQNDLEITAPGYNSLKTYFEAGQTTLNITVWLDPLSVPSQMRPETIASNLRDGS